MARMTRIKIDGRNPGCFQAKACIAARIARTLARTSKRQLCRFFAGDFLGRFVFAHSEEGGLAQVAVAGPFGEANFADEFWVEPGAAFHFGGGEAAAKAAGFFREIHEWAIGPSQFLELLMK